MIKFLLINFCILCLVRHGWVFSILRVYYCLSFNTLYYTGRLKLTNKNQLPHHIMIGTIWSSLRGGQLQLAQNGKKKKLVIPAIFHMISLYGPYMAFGQPKQVSRFKFFYLKLKLHHYLKHFRSWGAIILPICHTFQSRRIKANAGWLKQLLG